MCFPSNKQVIAIYIYIPRASYPAKLWKISSISVFWKISSKILEDIFQNPVLEDIRQNVLEENQPIVVRDGPALFEWRRRSALAFDLHWPALATQVAFEDTHGTGQSANTITRYLYKAVLASVLGWHDCATSIIWPTRSSSA